MPANATTEVAAPAPATRKKRLRYLWVALGLLAIIGALGALKYAEIATVLGFARRAQAAGPPPESVGTAVAAIQRWSDTLNAVGSVTTARGVTVSNDIPGIVAKIDFDSGVRVREGQVLVELDTSVERAQLAEARAHLELAQTNAKRTSRLVASGALPEQQRQADESQRAAAAADVNAIEAQIARKIIRAPFAGKIGIRLVNVGQYLAPGTPIAQLESEKTTFADFSLPQEDAREIAVGMPVRLTLGASQDAGEQRSAEGKVYAIEPAVNPATRSLNVRATVPDGRQSFRPGMFVSVTVIQGKAQNVVAVPATAIVHAPYGDSVFVVERAREKRAHEQPASTKATATARQQFVRVGPMQGDYVAVESGVKAGEEVVTAGAFKLRNGASIVTNNDVKAEAELSPHPSNR